MTSPSESLFSNLKRERHRATWRAVALAPDPTQLILAIFGAGPA